MALGVAGRVELGLAEPEQAAGTAWLLSLLLACVLGCSAVIKQS